MSEQTTEAQQTSEENQQERPDWLPENFKAPEDLAKSYRELQGKDTRTSQENAQLKQQIDQYESLLAQEQQQEQFPHDEARDKLLSAFEEDPLAVMAYVAQNAAAATYQNFQQNQQPNNAQQESQAILAGKYAEDRLAARYQDWRDYREKVSQEIETNPDLYPESLFETPAGIEKALDRAYKSAKLDSLSSSTEQTLEEAIAAQRAAKIAAQTLTGQGGRPPAQDPWEARWEAIKAADTTSYRDIAG